MSAIEQDDQQRTVLRYPYVDFVDCRDRSKPQIEHTWSALIRALQLSASFESAKLSPELLSRQMRRLHRHLGAQIHYYRNLVLPADPRRARFGETRILYQRAAERLELLNVTPRRQAPIHDYPWSGVHYIVHGELRLRRYRRLHLVARPWLYELALRSDQTLHAGDVVQYDTTEGSIHEFTVQSEYACILSVCTGRGVQSRRCRYEPLGDLGYFEELVLADAVPLRVDPNFYALS